MTVLVTGAAGFLGAAVVSRLGERAVAGTRHHGDQHRLGGWSGRRVSLDVHDPVEVRRVVAQLQPTAIVHAAVVRDAAGAADATTEVAGLDAVCAAAAAEGVRHVVVFGSAAEYGRARWPMREDGASLPTTRHGVAKAAGTAAAHRWAAQPDLTVTVLRPFHVTGDGEPLHKLVPRALAAANGGLPLPLVDGDPVRDLVHVQDVADAVLAALQRPVVDALPVNLCSGVGTRISQILAELGRVLGRAVPTAGRHPASAFDAEHRIGDPSRATALWGWRAAELGEVLARCAAAWPWGRP